MGEAVIKTVELSRWYGQVIALTSVSLEIGQGVTGLLGPNGAGKSTLMKVLTGQLKPSNGVALIFDAPVWNNPAVIARLGLCPEHDAFYEDMSAHAFVTYMLQLHGFLRHDAEKLSRRTLEQLSLGERLGDPIKTYSKGMRQRVKIAQAIAHDPDVLFLDEPLTGADPIGRRQIIDLIHEMGQQGKTVVVSSHVLHEVEAMTDTILLVHKGQVVADGNVDRIRSMVDDHSHTIFIDTDKPRELAKLMSGFDDVISISFDEDGLRVGTRDPNVFYDRLPGLILEHDLQVRRMTSPDNTLAAVFRYLTNLGYQQKSGA